MLNRKTDKIMEMIRIEELEDGGSFRFPWSNTIFTKISEVMPRVCGCVTEIDDDIIEVGFGTDVIEVFDKQEADLEALVKLSQTVSYWDDAEDEEIMCISKRKGNYIIWFFGNIVWSGEDFEMFSKIALGYIKKKNLKLVK